MSEHRKTESVKTESARRPEPDRDAAKTFDDVLRDELTVVELRREAWRRAIQGDVEPPGDTTQHDLGTVGSLRRASHADLSDAERLRRRAFDKGMFGLALSGGGIRSATFCLGVLQTLGKLNLLSRVDYLSTVSGGGYIGGWFSSLLHRTLERDREDVAVQSRAGNLESTQEIDRQVRSKARGIFRLERELGGNCPPLGSAAMDDPEKENPSIGFLRRYSNYLTPRVGFLSVDTWTAVATYLRNLLLNFAILLALTGAVLLTPRFVTAALIALEDLVNAPDPAWLAPFTTLNLLVLAAIFLTLIAATTIASGLMDLEKPNSQGGLRPEFVICSAVLTIVAAAMLQSVTLASLDAQGLTLLQYCIRLAVAALLLWSLAGVFACRLGPRRRAGRWWPRGWTQWVISGAIVAFVGGAALWAFGKTRIEGGLLYDDWLAAAWAPPLLVLWLVTVGAVQTGLAGTAFHDSQREWLNRLGAWLLIAAGAWNLTFFLILVGPPILMSLGPLFRTLLVGSWIGTTAAGLFTARSKSETQGGRIGKLAMGLAPAVFVIGFLLSVALVLDWAVDRAGTVIPSTEKVYTWKNWIDASEKVNAEFDQWQFLHQHDPLTAGATPPRVWPKVRSEHFKLLDATRHSLPEVAGLYFVLVLVALFLGWRVDINEFSMHGFYRNRLVRAFLGASRQGDRNQNPVTGFSRQDDIPLADLRPHDGDRYFLPRPPIHLVNTAVNMISTEELAWQERKAASFVLSPYHCGYEVRQDGLHGYRETRRGYGNAPAPLTLGGAVATSGAAVSPNMGFRTSTSLAALLTLFNVRLGRWIGNPGDSLWNRSGPRFALQLLVQELLRGTSQRKEYLYLSDGGHFENLGLYELVRRRCRYVVVVDAGADPDLSFTDLGNAIRKCRIDLRVKIEVDLEPLKKDADGLSNWHCIVGKIRYPEGDDCVGMLLYLKASLTGDEPADILEYRSVHPDFPHQSTGDQFFDESQFESYRALGRHASQDALEWAVSHSMTPLDPRSFRHLHQNQHDWPPHEMVDLETMRVNLEHRWRSPSRATAEAFTRHSAQLDELHERARNSPDLRFLDPQVYPEWDQLMKGSFTDDEDARGRAGTSALRLPKTEEERRAGFYYCYSLIQLMENVYLDLELASEHGHPDNRGWMNLFNHWTWSPMFRATWSMCSATFGRRFQSFCEKHLGMSQGTVKARTLWNDFEPRTAGELEDRLAQHKQTEPFLNFVETDQSILFTRGLTAYEDLPELGRLTQVVSFRLEVESIDPAQDDELLGFGIGYALLGHAARPGRGTPTTQILLFRIQDHLRNLGLGRSALTTLLETQDDRIDGLAPAAIAPFRAVVDRLQHRDDSAAVHLSATHFVQEFRGGHRGFLELVDSVLAERENSRRLRD